MNNRTYGLSGDKNIINELHKMRQIFAIVDGKIKIAPENVTYSHKEWLDTLNLSLDEVESIMNNNLRGYISPDGNIYLYKGYDFDFDKSLIEQSRQIVIALKEKIFLNENCLVYGGVQMGEAGKPWPPKMNLGKIKDFAS